MGRQSRPLTGEAKPQGWPTGAAIRACEFRRSATLCIEVAKGSKPTIWTEASRDAPRGNAPARLSKCMEEEQRCQSLRTYISTVMPAHSRPRDGVATLAYVAGIHALLCA